MRNRFKLLAGAAVLVLAVSFAWVGLGSAHSFRSGDNVTAGPNEKIDDTLFAAGRTIDINSEVFGDVFCAGQTVTVSGTVHGDVICAGQTVNVTGTVDGDVRLAGQTVTIGADVSGNATIAGQTFNLESTGSIGGDVSVVSTDATLNGSVGRHLAATGNNLTVASAVGGNIKSSVTDLTLASGARVRGDVAYTSWNDVNRADGAVVNGTITRSDPSKGGASKRGAIFGFGFGWFVYMLLAMLFATLALTLLFPRLLHNVTDQGMPRPWKALLTGFTASLAMPVILIVLAITVIGIPFAFLVGLAWLVIQILSVSIFAYYIGRMIMRETNQPLLIMLVGASVLLVAYFIPIIGFLAVLSTIWFGAGMLLLELFDRTPRPEYSVASTTPARPKARVRSSK